MIKLNICIAIAILACFCIMCMGEKVLGRPKHHHKKHTLKKHTHKHHHAQARFKKADDKEADDKEADAEEANDDKEKKEKKGGGKKVKEGEAVDEPVAEAAGGKAAGPTGETGAVSLTDILQNSALPVKHSGINVPGSGGGLVEQLQSENGDSGKREPGQFIPFGKNIPKKAGIIYYTSTGVQECEICKLINKNAYLLGHGFYDLCKKVPHDEYKAMCLAQQMTLRAYLGGTQALRSPCPSYLTCHYCLGLNPLYCRTGPANDKW